MGVCEGVLCFVCYCVYQGEVGGGRANSADKRTNHTARGNRGAVSGGGIARAVTSTKAANLIVKKKTLIVIHA